VVTQDKLAYLVLKEPQEDQDQLDNQDNLELLDSRDL
jgi:hypothetical protein